jgi:hypothetical protein
VKLGGKIEFSIIEVSETSPVINMNCSAGNDEKATAITRNIASSGTSLGGVTLQTVNLPDNAIYAGKVSRVGSNILIRELPISFWYEGSSERIEEFLPKLTAYLKDNGCTNFEYSVASKAHD